MQRQSWSDIHLHSPEYRDKAIDEFQAVLEPDPMLRPALALVMRTGRNRISGKQPSTSNALLSRMLELP